MLVRHDFKYIGKDPEGALDDKHGVSISVKNAIKFFVNALLQ